MHAPHCNTALRAWLRLSALLCLWCACTPRAAAQTPAEQTLATATVTASLAKETLTGDAAYQKIDTAALRRRGITDTGDALRRMAGINLRDYGGAGGLKTVSVRGLGAAHTAVTYDGLAMTDARQGETDLQAFNIDRLASIALRTGGAARLLCPVRNVAAAVVELTSLLPDSTQRRPAVTAALRQGSFGMANPSLGAGGRVGERGAWNVGADYFHARNNYSFLVDNGIATHRERRTNSLMNAGTGEAAFSFATPGGGTWLTKGYFHESRRELPGQVILYTNENDEHLRERTAFAQTSWRQLFASNRVEVFAAGKYANLLSHYRDIDAQYPGGGLSQRYVQQEAYATAGAALHLDKWSFALAADYALGTMRSNLKTDNDVLRHTLLQSTSVRFHTDRFALTARAVASLIDNKVKDNAARAARRVSRLSPSVGAVWRVLGSETTRRGSATLRLRADYRETFRAPTFTESYFYHLGSQSLRPETVRQGGGGFTLDALSRSGRLSVQLTVDAYANRTADRIVSIPIRLFCWKTVNLGTVRGLGLDATLDASYRCTARHLLILAANYSLAHVTDRTDPADRSTFGKQLPYAPLHSGAASIAWENPWVNCVAHLTFATSRWTTAAHTSGTLLPAYTDAGFGLYRQFATRSVRWEARAELINAFGTDYQVIARYPMPGRAYKLTLIMNY